MSVQVSTTRYFSDTYAVCSTRIGHRVTSVTVGDVLVDERSLTSSGVFLSILYSSLNGKDVHAVNLQAWNILAALVVFGKSGRAVGSSTHAIFVVYALLVGGGFGL